MHISKNRFISGLLAFVMAMAIVLEIVPPIAVNAADSETVAAQSNILNVDDLDGKDSDEVVVDKQDITLEWNKLTGDASYRLRIRSSEEGQSTTIDMEDYTQTQYTISEDWLIPGVKYVVNLYRYDANGNQISDGHRRFYFLVAGGESILSESLEMISPKLGGYGFPYDNLVVSWNLLQYATSYKILLEYYCGASGSSTHEVLQTELDNTTSSYIIPVELLQEGTEYKLKLYAYDKLGNDLSKTLYFSTEGDVDEHKLSDPVITSPYFTDQYFPYGNIKTIPVYDNVTVTWNKTPTATRYDVSLKPDGGDMISLPDAEQITTTQYTIPLEYLSPGVVYEVVITAYHDGDYDCYKESEFYFRAPYPGNLVLDAPLLTSHDLSTDLSEPTSYMIQKTDLEWNVVSAAKEYRVDIVSTENSDFKLTYKNLTQNSLSIPYRDIYEMFDNGEIVRIEVTAYDSYDNSTFSEYYIELTENPISKPVIISPAFAENETETLPSFEADEDLQLSWNEVDTAVKYRVYLWEYYNGGWDELLRWDDLTDTTFTIPGKYLYDCGKFMIRIAAYNSYGKSSGAARYYFQTGTDNGILLTAPSAEITAWKPSCESTYKYINVNTVDAWTAAISDSWIQLNKMEGDGTSSVKIDITENSDLLPRTGTVTFTTNSGKSVVLTIVQAANGISNDGNLVILNPEQGDSFEKEKIRAKWNYKYTSAYFNIELKNLSTDAVVHSENTIITSYADIPASVLNGDTNYLLTVRVYTPSKTCVDESSVIFTVLKSDNVEDTQKPVINPISCSVDSLMYGSSVTFSTKASDDIALNKVEMYIDDELVKTVFATGTAAKISYTTDSLSIGNHIVFIKAFDESGNTNSWSEVFTVQSASAGFIYSVELSDYDFYAGTTITFTVTTSVDTTKIRLLDGSYAFSEQNSGYKDSDGKRIWKFEQYVGTVGSNRKLKVETYSGGWTGNTFVTEPFTVRKNEGDIGKFEILSHKSGSKHQFNTDLIVRWSEPNVKPDWYVVNVTGVPSGSNLISVSGTTAVISGSVFDEYGTYSISVTAQKEGYNQTEAYVNIIVDCLHNDTQRINPVYGNEYYYDESQHSVTIIPQYMCNICGGTFTNANEAYTEYRVHDKDIKLDNDGWYCECGYVNTGTYKTWEGELLSDTNQSVYREVDVDGTLSHKHGTVFVSDDILVCGTKYDALFIRYPISNGYKYGFISSGLVQDSNYSDEEILSEEEIYRLTLSQTQFDLWYKLKNSSMMIIDIQSGALESNDGKNNYLLFEQWAQNYEDSLFEQIKNAVQSGWNAAEGVLNAITLDFKGAVESFSEIDTVGKRKNLYKAAIKNHITKDVPTSLKALIQEQLTQLPIDIDGSIIKDSLDLGKGIYGVFKEYSLNDIAVDNIVKICESMDFRKFNVKTNDLYERLLNYSTTVNGETHKITDYFYVSKENADVVRSAMKSIKDSKTPAETVKELKELKFVEKASKIGSYCGTFITSMDTLIEIIAINSALETYQDNFNQYADLDISDAIFDECVSEVIDEYMTDCIQTFMKKEAIIFADFLYKQADIDKKITKFISEKIPYAGDVISTTAILNGSMSVIDIARELLFNTNAIRDGLNSLPELRNSVHNARVACVTMLCNYKIYPSPKAFYELMKAVEYYELIGTLGTEVLLKIEEDNYNSIWNVLQRKEEELAESNMLFRLNPWYQVRKALSDTGSDEEKRLALWDGEMEKLFYFRTYIYN